MKKCRLNILFVIAAVFLAILPPLHVQAKVCEFTDMNMEITVPEDTIILTQDTKDMDELWLKAGITDPKTEKSNMAKMGSRAILYDPKTDTAVNLLQKQSSQSVGIFNLSLLSDEEFNKFLNDMATVGDDNTVVHIEKYPQKEIPFFRLSVELTNGNTVMREIVFGTVVNGVSMSYHFYDKNSTKKMDESFIKELVAGTHFTKVLTKADYEREKRAFLMSLLWKVAAIVAVIILWVIIHRIRRSRKETSRKRKLELQEHFNNNQKLKEEQHIKDKVLYINRTRYSEEVIKDFCYYNAIFRRINLWIMVVVLGILLFITYYQSGSSVFNYVIAIALLIAVIYFIGTQVDKKIKQTVKNYGSYINKEAVSYFYEDYFTVSGLQYKSDFPYLQITDIREYKAFYYIYIGERSIYIKKDGFEQGAEEFKSFIKKRISRI